MQLHSAIFKSVNTLLGWNFLPLEQKLNLIRRLHCFSALFK